MTSLTLFALDNLGSTVLFAILLLAQPTLPLFAHFATCATNVAASQFRVHRLQPSPSLSPPRDFKVVAAIDSLFISGILTLADEPSKPADMNGGADSSMEVAPGSPAPTGGAATGADSIDADADDRDSLLSESAINRLGPI
uniref:Uncharacterized protein n=1 Tax=Chrysotila carterae TaxID=13221 RepID=A0A7S4F3I4_CHRCT